MQRLLEKIREILRNRRTRRLFSRAVSLVAAFLVFVTTYALVLPAITLEKTASCGMDEHQHSDSCYESVLICGQEESEGHHHDDSCYTVTKELNCQLEEHRHSREAGCYDEEGNLICQLSEHTHDDSCYREVKTLTCGREESEGHHHTDACYQKVLVCGKEVHTHSEACYKDGGNAGETNEEAADQASSVSMPENSSGEKTAEAAAEEKLSENDVPKLDALNMEAVFGKKTGFYYFHAGEGQEVPSNSSEITDWRRVKEDTKLAPTDLVKIYLPYSISAGSLNGTNPTARYRLPANIHLTDEQIKAINKNENGITAGFSKSDPEYRKYLGAVAIEGSRTPDELLKDGTQEYISAIVRAENVFENDKYLGQDLIFTFVPYTIAKNQKTFDKEKKPVSAGREVTGWFACDFRLNQIDWIEEEIEEETVEEEVVEEGAAGEEVVEEEVIREEEQEETDRGSADPAEITVEKTAEILFVSEDKTKDIKEIKRTLKLVDTASEEEGTEEETQEFQSGTLTADGDGYKITLDYTEEAKIPENASLSVREITAETDKEAYEACLAQAQQHVDESGEARSTVDSRVSRFFDIEIQVTNEDGTTQKIEPAVPVSVNIQIADAPAANDDTADSESGSGDAQHSDPTVLHFAEDGVEQIEATSESVPTESGNVDASEDNAIESKAAEVRFEAESFSIYGVVYTVDFHWEVDGKMYEFSLPGGGFVSFSKLAEVLGIISDKNSEENVDQNEAETPEIEKESDTASSLTLGDVMVSDAAREFAADVESVEFSSPELVDVSRVENDTTVGQIKEVRGLQVQYSAELTQEQIEEINAQTVEAGDWALISVQPFTSEETMTVTMKDGEVFTIQVTDYQISTNVLTADGRNYKITVTYDDNAEIPSGTKLTAEEIMPGTDEYLQHLGKAWAEVNKDYLVQEEEKQKNIDGLDEYEDIRPVNLDDARFFNIRLIYGEKEIEPKAPVHVDIEYVEGFNTVEEEEDQVIGVAHYKKDETELITDVRTEKNEAGEIVEFVYEQDSFSDIGTYVGQKTYDNVPYKMSKALAMPLLRALTNATRNGTQLKDIEAHKKLTNNDDGTYTMSLTVKGDSVANEEYNKANILFVMDRSSSMTSNNVYQDYTDTTYPGGTTYYRKNGNNYEALFLNNGQVCTRAWSGGMSGSWVYTPYTGTVYTSVTRLVAEQAAMDVLIQNLLGKNDSTTPGKEDLIEISVISFAEDRQSGDTEYTEWTSNDYDGLMEAVNQTNTPSGTNWEDALIYAREQAYIKKQSQPDEDVYVIFLTDGEPTAVYGEHSGAQHYISSSTGQVRRGGFEFALTEDSSLYSGTAGEDDGKNSLDRAKEIVDDGYKFYGIFTFNPGEAQTKYLRRLMNFAYTGVDKAYENDETKEDTDIVKKYFTNADTPETLTAAFEKIFADVSSMLGHGDVVITDGLQAADAMTTTIHADRADGFRYSVTDDTTGEELYYVTATGSDSNPTVTFHIGDQPYPAGASKTGVDGKPYYSVTVNGTEYTMALADLSGRELTWDLSAIGTLLPGCTYKVDIIVWPNQAAYDYVAGLNNKLPGYSWDPSVESNPDNYHEVTVDGVTYGYYTGGVSGHDSIVKYKDSEVYSVLTNTHQELNYSIVNTKTNEVTGETTTTSDPQDPVSLEPQKPMDLVDTNSKIEK